MATTKPSNGPLVFTSATNRTALTSGLRTSGFPPGTIIPAGENNETDYEAGQWLDFIRSAGGEFPMTGAQAVVSDATGGTVSLMPGGALGVRITAGAVVPSGAAIIFPTSWCPGDANKISVYVDNITAVGTVALSWLLFDPTVTNGTSAARCGTAARNYTAADNGTTVDQAITVGTPDLTGPCFLAGTLTFTTAGDSIDIEIVKIVVD